MFSNSDTSSVINYEHISSGQLSVIRPSQVQSAAAKISTKSVVFYTPVMIGNSNLLQYVGRKQDVQY